MNEEDQKLFQEYLDGAMSSMDKKRFEGKLWNDSEFKKNFELYKEMNSYLGESELHGKALEKLRSYMPDNETSESKTKSWLIPVLLFSILIAGLLFLWQKYVETPSTKTNEQLYAEYFDPGEISLSQRGYEMDSLLNIAQYNFNHKAYDEALRAFKLYESLNDSLNTSLDFYKAICLLNENQLGQIIKLFDKVSESSELYKRDVFWYKALSYLKLNDNDLAKKELLQIDKSSVHYQKALRFLKEI